MARGEVKYRLTVDAKDFERGMNVAARQVSELSGQFMSKLGPAGEILGKMGPLAIGAATAVGVLTVAVAGTAKVLLDATLATAKFADNLSALKTQTGLSFKALQEFGLAAKLGNSSVEAIAAGVNKMQNSLIKGSAAFGMLGINVSTFKKLAPEDQLRVVAQQIDKLGSDAEKTAARIAIFGKSGNQMADTLKAISSGAAEMGGALSDEAVEGAAALQDQLDRLDEAWDRVIRQVGAAIAQSPELMRALGEIEGVLISIAEWFKTNQAGLTHYFDEFVKGARKAAYAAQLLHAAMSDEAAFKLALGATGGDISLEDPKRKPRPGGFNPRAYAAAEAAAKKAQADAKKLNDLWADPTPWEKFKSNLGFGFDMLGVRISGAKDLFIEAQERLDKLAILRGPDMAAIGGDFAGSAAQAKAARDWRDELAQVADIFQQIGGSTGGMIGDMLAGVVNVGDSMKQWKTAGSGFAGVLSKIGAAAGIAGTVFGIGKSLVGAIMGGQKEHMQVNDMRDSFIAAAGGLGALNAKAAAAGLTLDKLLSAKKVTDFNAAVGQLTGAFDIQGEAEARLQDAIDRYGFSIDQLGPKFQQQKLDEQVGGLITDYNLLIQSGIENVDVIKQMAPAINDYVNQALSAGAAIPESMRGAIDQMIKMGLLVDENGDAFASAEDAGITFTQSLSEGLSKLIDKLDQFLRALGGASNIDLPNIPDMPGRATGPGEAGPMRGEDFGHAGGTQGFQDFGGGTPTTLHGMEAVFRPNDLQAVARMMSSVQGGGGGGRTLQPVNLIVGQRQFGRVVADVTVSGRSRLKQPLRGRAR